MSPSFPVEYFLGANAPSGFYSLYSQLLPLPHAQSIYLLKGGPGCGKSTFLRQVARAAEQNSLRVEYILCSGDPDSLDAIVIPSLRVALADATAPHVLEPNCPGAVDCYVDLGQCYDRSALKKLRFEIHAATDGYKQCYQRAYRCLNAAGTLCEDIRGTVLTDTAQQWLTRRARSVLHRELRAHRRERIGQVKQRFLNAVTHKGYLSLYDTALAQCPTVYELQDNYGLSHELLLPLLTGAVELGLDVVACPDPMAPDRLLHLLIPETGTAFLSSTPSAVFPDTPKRRIRLDSGCDTSLLRLNRTRLRFAKKVSASLIDEAVSSLAQAKSMHDELEAIYNPYVDFDRVSRLAAETAGEILSLM